MENITIENLPQAAAQSIQMEVIGDLASNQYFVVQQHLSAIANTTFQVINQTIREVMQATQDQELTQKHSFQEDWNFLYFLRLFFYIVVFLKIFVLVFSKRRKLDIKQRVYKKFIFSHSQMIRQFNEEDRKVMEVTLNNTIKNAYIQKKHLKLQKKLSKKRVNFHETRNQYFQPKKMVDNQQSNLSPLFSTYVCRPTHQSAPVKMQQMQRQVQQDLIDQQLQVTQRIRQSLIIQGNLQITQKKGQSTITQDKQTNDIIQTKDGQLEIESSITQNKQKSL